jgi:hypothetical protein
MPQGSRRRLSVSRLLAATVAQALIFFLIAQLALPPLVLAQQLPQPPGLPGVPQGITPGSLPNPFGQNPFLTPGNPQVPGQAILTNPNALQPIVPAVTPCPVPVPPDLTQNGIDGRRRSKRKKKNVRSNIRWK